MFSSLDNGDLFSSFVKMGFILFGRGPININLISNSFGSSVLIINLRIDNELIDLQISNSISVIFQYPFYFIHILFYMFYTYNYLMLID